MTVKNDKWIRKSGILDPCLEFTNIETDLKSLGMPYPKVQGETYDPYAIQPAKMKKIISKGISSYGYDLTCSDEFKIFTNVNCTVVDPKDFKDDNFVLHTGDYCIIPPNSFVLTRSVEYIRMPRNIVGICMGKSTYARCGVVANTTLLEPEWEGHLVIELSNTTPLPVKIYANEGIAQVVFMEANDVCEVSYKDRKGKYNGQTGIQVAKV